MFRPSPYCTIGILAVVSCSSITDPPRLATAIPAEASATVAAANSVVRTYGNWQITMTDLGAVTPTGQSTAYAINDLGDIVGIGYTASGLTVRPIWINGVISDYLQGTNGRPLIWNNRRETVGINVVNSKIACSVFWIPGLSGQFPTLPGGRSCATSAYDVNAHGEMAGSSETTVPTFEHHPVTWKNGQIFRDLGMPPGASRANAAGINDAGDLAGTLTDATTFRTHAFVHRNGVYSRLTPLPGPYGTEAIDINNRGDVLGYSNGGNYVVWPAGSSTPVQLPMAGRYVHRLQRINENGDVIGAVSGAPSTGVFYSAALWRNGQFIDLGTWPGGIESYAYGINANGTIVGVSNVPVGVYGLHAMMWTVTPLGGGNTAPAVALAAVSPTTLSVGGTLTVRGTWTDPDVGDGPWAYTWRWQNGPTRGTWTAPGTYTASRVYAKAGTYNVSLQVTDARGATTTSNAIQVTVR